MFKKIILILILSSIPTNSFAQENYDNVYWTGFDWDSVIPDQNTIRLANFYLDIEKQIKKSINAKINIINMNELSEQKKIILTKLYTNAAISFGDDLVNLYIIDKSGVDDFNRTFYNWNNPSIKNMFVNCNIKQQKACFQADFLNRDYSYAFLDESKENFELTPYHELAHVFFWNLFDSGKYPNNCWMSEGFSNALGLAISSQYSDLDNYRNEFILRIKESNLFPKDFRAKKEQLVQEFIQRQNDYSWCYDPVGAGYSLGMLIAEFIYIEYGVATTHSFFKHLAESNSFEISSQKYFKLSEKMFFNHAYEYVFDCYEKALTRAK